MSTTDPNLRLVDWEAVNTGRHIIVLRQSLTPGGWRIQIRHEIIEATENWWQRRFALTTRLEPSLLTDELAKGEARLIGEQAGGGLIGDDITQRLLAAIDGLIFRRPSPSKPSASGRLVKHRSVPRPDNLPPPHH